MDTKYAIRKTGTPSLKTPAAFLSIDHRQQATGNRQQATGNYTLP
jgi:hypothetical protein